MSGKDKKTKKAGKESTDAGQGTTVTANKNDAWWMMVDENGNVINASPAAARELPAQPVVAADATTVGNTAATASLARKADNTTFATEHASISLDAATGASGYLWQDSRIGQPVISLQEETPANTGQATTEEKKVVVGGGSEVPYSLRPADEQPTILPDWMFGGNRADASPTRGEGVNATGTGMPSKLQDAAANAYSTSATNKYVPPSADQVEFTRRENVVTRAHDELFGIGRRDRDYGVMTGPADYSSSDYPDMVVNNGTRDYRKKVEKVVAAYEKRFLEHPQERTAIYVDLLKKYNETNNGVTNGGEYRDALGLFARAAMMDRAQRTMDEPSLPRFTSYEQFKYEMVDQTIARYASLAYPQPQAADPEKDRAPQQPTEVTFDKNRGKVIHVKADDELFSIAMRCTEELGITQQAMGNVLPGQAAVELAEIMRKKNKLPSYEEKLAKVSHIRGHEKTLDKIGTEMDLVLPDAEEIKLAVAAAKAKGQFKNIAIDFDRIAEETRQENERNSHIKVPDENATTVCVNPGDKLSELIAKAPEAIAATQKLLQADNHIATPEQAALVLQIAVAAEYKLATANYDQGMGNLGEVQIPSAERIQKYIQSMSAAKGIMSDGFIYDDEVMDKNPILLAQPLLKNQSDRSK